MDSDKREKSIPASHYTKEYFLSGEYYHSANEYKKFVKGNKPADVYLKAAGYVLQTGSETYLDIGCGKGELVIFLARLRKSVIGIDYSPSAIEICQDALKFATNPVRKHAQFKFADTSHLPFDNDTFDAVFMLDVIEHLTKIEIQKALDELTRVLKKNGKVIIHTNNKYFERGTKLLIAASYHGLKAFLHPKKYLQDATQSDNPY